ncbi:MAG: recombinase family protein [Defluviitaleaceae bacterium]|nr:recombinase family protein [Defluviitaleaceae bacterium]
MNKLYSAGLYVRLSVEDAANSRKRGKANPFRHESTSIENQQAILREYALLRGWSIVRTYIDDGFSGGSYNRPAFYEMLEDAKAGLINLILVKDLSRLGRGYIETGHYTDEAFPSLGVRFIALMDGIDSENDSDFLPFRSLLNDYYLKDLSRKIKSVLRAKALSGGYVGTYAPYGFKKNPESPNRLAVDNYAAKIVHRIFTMRVQGLSHGKIAATLNNDGILSPRDYRFQREKRSTPYNENNMWQPSTIRAILRNEAYLGHSLKFKNGTASYKNRSRIIKPENNWVRSKNIHPAIVSQDLWNAAQSIKLNTQRLSSKSVKANPLFAGILKCADCGGRFVCNVKKQARNNGRVVRYVGYTCRMYSHTGRSKCSPHSISELRLLEIVRQDIHRHLELANIDEERISKELQRHVSELFAAESTRELERLEGQMAELESLGTNLYEDRLSGAISPDMFKTLSAAAEEERAVLQEEHDKLAKSTAKVERHPANEHDWLDSIRSFLKLKKPDRKTLTALIERIEVGKNEGVRQNIRIIYSFIEYVP